MISLRKIAIAGTVAIAGALSAGAASAQPSLDLSIPTASDSAVQQAYYPGGYYKSPLCYVPFFKLVRWYGYFRAQNIKRNCFYTPYYNNYYGYKKY